ncbi:AGE family epimerase/isomerase [Nocardiopsis sediminis]|uniref:AGE family epimerase/isomerase n=1 Tax=Nocardiopsis sediminis TaxID=1778267 RepID=A0ABV8FLM5_9ACTN
MTDAWVDLPVHRAWLHREELRLTDFGAAAALPGGGFGWLDGNGRRTADPAVHTWITARMTHVYSLAHLRGVPGAGPLADNGLAALTGRLHDEEHGGWFSRISTAEGVPAGTGKNAYDHAFVILAAASATAAGRTYAEPLLADALDVVGRHFFDAGTGLSVEGYDRDWSSCEDYRGANSNMHLVEAFLAAADATGDTVWRDRALGIAEQLIHRITADNGWRLPEHFSAGWEPVLDYNRDHPADPFRPFGSTVGHWMEWARLLVALDASLGAAAPGWLVEDAERLFSLAVGHGWSVDGAPGFVYTLDWDDRPVVRERMHWVPAEALMAAAALHRRTGDALYEEWYRTLWDYVRRYLIDTDQGSWHHELAPDNTPSATVWQGKPDLYHAYQAVLLPLLPAAPAAASALLGNGVAR